MKFKVANIIKKAIYESVYLPTGDSYEYEINDIVKSIDITRKQNVIVNRGEYEVIEKDYTVPHDEKAIGTIESKKYIREWYKSQYRTMNDCANVIDEYIIENGIKSIQDDSNIPENVKRAIFDLAHIIVNSIARKIEAYKQLPADLKYYQYDLKRIESYYSVLSYHDISVSYKIIQQGKNKGKKKTIYAKGTEKALSDALKNIANIPVSDIIQQALAEIIEQYNNIPSNMYHVGMLFDKIEYRTVRSYVLKNKREVEKIDVDELSHIQIICRNVRSYIRSLKKAYDTSTKSYIDTVRNNETFYILTELVTEDEYKAIDTLSETLNMTQREIKVMQYFVSGMSVHEIAVKMKTSDSRIADIRKHIQEKYLEKMTIPDSVKIVTSENVTKIAQKVYVTLIDGTEIGTFDSIGIASKELNVDKSNISKCLKGKIKYTNGYIFKYAE